MNTLDKKMNNLTEQIVFSILATFCIGAVCDILLYVLVHGYEKGIWEYRYLIDLFIAVLIITLICRNQKIPGLLRTIEHIRPGFIACILISISFLTQYFVVSSVHITPNGDYAVFQSVALDISVRETINLAEYVALFPHILGYSSFIGSLYHVFGRADIAPIINVFLGSLSTLFLFSLVYNHSHCISSSTIVSILWIVCPSMLFYNTMVLSEPLYTTGILFFFLLISIVDQKAVNLAETSKKRSAISFITAGLMGFFFGLVLQSIQVVRPLSYVLLVTLAISAVCFRHTLFQNRTTHHCCLIFFCLLLISFYVSGLLWSRYAFRILEEVPASIPGYNFLTGFNPGTSGTHSEADYQLLLTAREAEGATASSAQRAMLDHLFRRLKSGTGFYPRLLFEKGKIFVGSDDYAVFYAGSAISILMKRLTEHLSNIYYYILLILVILSCAQLKKNRSASRIVFLVSLFILGLSFAHILFLEVNGRYHYPLIPLFLYIVGVMLSEKHIVKNSN